MSMDAHSRRVLHHRVAARPTTSWARHTSRDEVSRRSRSAARPGPAELAAAGLATPSRLAADRLLAEPDPLEHAPWIDRWMVAARRRQLQIEDCHQREH